MQYKGRRPVHKVYSTVPEIIIYTDANPIFIGGAARHRDAMRRAKSASCELDARGLYIPIRTKESIMDIVLNLAEQPKRGCCYVRGKS